MSEILLLLPPPDPPDPHQSTSHLASSHSLPCGRAPYWEIAVPTLPCTRLRYRYDYYHRKNAMNLVVKGHDEGVAFVLECAYEEAQSLP